MKQKKKNKKKLVQVIKKEKPQWYSKLILDLKKIQFETIVKGKWLIGKRIIEDETKTEYGEETIKNIARDMGTNERELWLCIQFARKCDDVTLFTDKSWRFITHNYLPTPKPKDVIEDDTDIERLGQLDNNMFYFLHHYYKKRFGDKVIAVDVHREDDVREYTDYYPTITKHSRLFDKNGKEFNLRKYADIQDFPHDFKFVGSSQDIKNQIGEAVSPKMAEYIINKYIKGKTYIELFAGCGGFSVGAHKLQKKCLWCIDFNKYSTHSFKLNFPDTEVCIGDIKKVDEKKVHKKIGDIDFIIGGPPCQGFSIAGKRLGFKEDERNQLYLDFIRFLKEFKPKQFIMENVKEIIQYQDEIKKDFEKIGYNIIVEKVNGLDIGMKQKRIRVFFIGNSL